MANSIDKKVKRFQKKCQKDIEKFCPKNSRGESLYTVLYAGFDAMFKDIKWPT